MVTIKPFAALRPKPDLAARVCELPYDVMSSEEARQLTVGNPLSFLHVSKPEIDLAPSVDIYSPEVYAKGKENFQRLMGDGVLRQEPGPVSIFIARLCDSTPRQVSLQWRVVRIICVALSRNMN
jgi:uncharacterized protein (DUF1015 family)